jgi:SAM-dependent methyltransferase
VLDGKVIGQCMARHRHQEFIRFLYKINRETPAAAELHLIVDNYATHKHPLVDAERAKFQLAAAEAIPFPDGSFDRAVAINVVYFWSDPVQALTEIRRVLRPGGLSIVAGMDSATAAAAPFYRAEFGFHIREADDLTAIHRAAGFTAVDIEPFDEMTKLGDGTPFARHYHLAIATR